MAKGDSKISSRTIAKPQDNRGKLNDTIESYTSTIVIGGITYKASEKTVEFAEERKNSGFWTLDDNAHNILDIKKQFYEKYQDGVADKDTYYADTIANFEETKRPRRNPDYVSTTRDGKISSEYWYTDGGVIRGSNHWGAGISSCDWYLERQPTSMKGKKQYGFASWEEFTLKTGIVTNDEKKIAKLTSFNNTKKIGKSRRGLSNVDFSW